MDGNAPAAPQRMQAVGGQLAGRHIVTDRPGRRRLRQQPLDEAGQLPVRVVDVLAPVQKRGQVGVVRPAVVHLGVGLQDGLDPLTGVSRLIPHVGELRQMPADLALVPGEKDRFDVGEVLVQGRAADAALRRDLRHRDRGQPLNGGQCTMQAADGVLTLRAEADDPATLASIQRLIAARLEKFGRRERLTVAWQRPQAS